ncbi:uncharacterized membrane protein (DUF2068 family) [Dokdonella fugitiva]|uniref:Uncharacterized membrane protein (DUF2068 family) n=1 Tax=Dokdonella fugitiva TaxID=328517 RepID=A0A839F2I4_9GAMM|nr:DUF2127 domain-containing protein [Dokdonella fugitiva]MBA8888796.1 uncharacterized membrane protein (DUF2068 family) [Dokdonella fugitiva]
MSGHRAIDVVAAVEAFKGAIVLVAASGLAILVHEDVGAIAEALVRHTHLNPASRYPRIFIEAAGHLQDAHLLWLACGAAAYSTLRFVEAWGLFRRAAWAEVLAAASGAIYVPFEVAGVRHHVGWIGLGSLVLNLLVVAVMLAALWRRRSGAGRASRP